jgi:hypothetical protein
VAEVVELIDRAVALPPGPTLSAALAELPWEQVPNARLVEVVQARSRQLAHEPAHLFAGMAEIARALPMAQLPADGRDVAVARAADDFEWAAHEIAAGLTWTPTAADRELSFALVLRGLPLVCAALEQGEIDRGKAKVFVDHLDPSRGELTPAQIRRLCERFVPLAPGLTTQQLSRRLVRAIVAIDPGFHRRRYRRGCRNGRWCCTWTATAPPPCPGRACRRMRRPPRPRGWTGWRRRRNGPATRGGCRRSMPTCFWECWTDRSTG